MFHIFVLIVTVCIISVQGNYLHQDLTIIIKQYEQNVLGCLIGIGFISQSTLQLARYNKSNDLSTFLCLPNNTNI